MESYTNFKVLGGEYVEKRSLIVNYLPQTMTEKLLFRIFVPYGYIESIKIMRDTATAYSYGFGFVNYATEKSAMQAKEHLNGYIVGNKRLKVSIARPPSEDIKGTNLFVSNLPPKCTEEDLTAWFSQAGRILNCSILRDKLTNQSRQMGFVRFENREEACTALKMLNRYVPNGHHKPIKAKVAEEHGKQNAAFVAGFKAALTQPISTAAAVGSTTTLDFDKENKKEKKRLDWTSKLKLTHFHTCSQPTSNFNAGSTMINDNLNCIGNTNRNEVMNFFNRDFFSRQRQQQQQQYSYLQNGISKMIKRDREIVNPIDSLAANFANQLHLHSLPCTMNSMDSMNMKQIWAQQQQQVPPQNHSF